MTPSRAETNVRETEATRGKGSMADRMRSSPSTGQLDMLFGQENTLSSWATGVSGPKSSHRRRGATDKIGKSRAQGGLGVYGWPSKARAEGLDFSSLPLCDLGNQFPTLSLSFSTLP